MESCQKYTSASTHQQPEEQESSRSKEWHCWTPIFEQIRWTLKSEQIQCLHRFRCHAKSGSKKFDLVQRWGLLSRFAFQLSTAKANSRQTHDQNVKTCLSRNLFTSRDDTASGPLRGNSMPISTVLQNASWKKIKILVNIFSVGKSWIVFPRLQTQCAELWNDYTCAVRRRGNSHGKFGSELIVVVSSIIFALFRVQDQDRQKIWRRGVLGVLSTLVTSGGKTMVISSKPFYDQASFTRFLKWKFTQPQELIQCDL